MSEKVRLPKEVCDSLDAVGKVHTYKTIISRHITKSWHEEYEFLNEGNIGTILLMRALVLGYEPEMTAEEQIKSFYFNRYSVDNCDYYANVAYKEGIRDALQAHKIHYDWMEDAE